VGGRDWRLFPEFCSLEVNVIADKGGWGTWLIQRVPRRHWAFTIKKTNGTFIWMGGVYKGLGAYYLSLSTERLPCEGACGAGMF